MKLNKTKMLDVFFKQRPIEVFLRINREGSTKRPELYRGRNITCSHAFRLINKFKKLELITEEKATGREFKISLTEKGKKLQGILFRIKELLENNL